MNINELNKKSLGHIGHGGARALARDDMNNGEKKFRKGVDKCLP
jgi:hypothetical protein